MFGVLIILVFNTDYLNESLRNLIFNNICV